MGFSFTNWSACIGFPGVVITLIDGAESPKFYLKKTLENLSRNPLLNWIKYNPFSNGPGSARVDKCMCLPNAMQNMSLFYRHQTGMKCLGTRSNQWCSCYLRVCSDYTMAQAVSRPPFAVKVLAHSETSPRRIYVRQSGNGTGFRQSVLPVLCIPLFVSDQRYVIVTVDSVVN